MFPFHKILCPTDLSEPSYRALLKASALALQFDGELYLLHVMQPSQDEAIGDTDRLDDIRDLVHDYLPKGLKVHSHVVQGDVTGEILRFAGQESMDLIIMATHGSTGWREFALGSVTDEIVRLAPCPVLTINSVVLDSTATPYTELPANELPSKSAREQAAAPAAGGSMASLHIVKEECRIVASHSQ